MRGYTEDAQDMAEMRYALLFIAWVVYYFAEAKHDWVAESSLFKASVPRHRQNEWKNWDALEKLTALLIVFGYEYLLSGWYMAALVLMWSASLRWVLHEGWLSLFSGRTYGQMGTTSDVDVFVNNLGLGNLANAIAISVPAIIFTILLIIEAQ